MISYPYRCFVLSYRHFGLEACACSFVHPTLLLVFVNWVQQPQSWSRLWRNLQSLTKNCIAKWMPNIRSFCKLVEGTGFCEKWLFRWCFSCATKFFSLEVMKVRVIAPNFPVAVFSSDAVTKKMQRILPISLELSPWEAILTVFMQQYVKCALTWKADIPKSTAQLQRNYFFCS